MILKVKRPLYDRYNPERIFMDGEYIKLEDESRIEFMIAEGLAEPVDKEPESFFVFGENIETKEIASKPVKRTPKKKG